jgi:hypothetical protein
MHIHDLLIHLAGQFLKSCRSVFCLLLLSLLTTVRVYNLVIFFHEGDHFAVDLRERLGSQLLVFPDHKVTEITFKNIGHVVGTLFIKLLGVRIQSYSCNKQLELKEYDSGIASVGGLLNTTGIN